MVGAQVAINKNTGEIGLVMPVYFRRHEENLHSLAGYSITLSSNEPDGYLVFSGLEYADGPWIFVKAEFANKNIELLGDL